MFPKDLLSMLYIDWSLHLQIICWFGFLCRIITNLHITRWMRSETSINCFHQQQKKFPAASSLSVCLIFFPFKYHITYKGNKSVNYTMFIYSRGYTVFILFFCLSVGVHFVRQSFGIVLNVVAFHCFRAFVRLKEHKLRRVWFLFLFSISLSLSQHWTWLISIGSMPTIRENKNMDSFDCHWYDSPLPSRPRIQPFRCVCFWFALYSIG